MLASKHNRYPIDSLVFPVSNLRARARAAEPAFFEQVLARFAETFSAPTDELPGIHCVSKTVLVRTLNRIRDRLAVPGYRSVPARTLIEHLQSSGLVAPVLVADPESGELTDRFYVIGLGASADSVEPIELLMALEPRGIVCYFTALQFHSLTTQLPPHHHVARLKDWGSRSTSAATGLLGSSSTRSFNPLGSERFRYQGISYYTTDRDRALVLGVQSRYLSERTRFRVTTLEQTLLDTLHRPLSCGGPAVVVEAWSTGADTLHPGRLAEYLDRLDDPALDRRVGFLLQETGYRSSGQLGKRLAEAAERAAREEAEVIALFQGYLGSHTDGNWRVEVP